MKYLSLMALLCCCLTMFSSCNKEEGEDLKNTQIETELAQKRYFEPWCLTCEGIDISIEKISEEDGCSIYQVNIIHKEECGPGTRHFMFVNGEYYSPITNNVNVFEFNSCDADVIKIEVKGKITPDPQSPWDAVCFSHTISSECNCESTELAFELIESDTDGCCVYAVNASIEDYSDDSDICEYSISIGDESYPFENGDLSIETTVCEGENVVAELYQGGIKCQEVEIECIPEVKDFCDYFEYEAPNVIDGECCFKFKTISDASFRVDFVDAITLQIINTENVTSDIDGKLVICVPLGQSILVTLLDIGPDSTTPPEIIDQIYAIWSPFCFFTC